MLFYACVLLLGQALVYSLFIFPVVLLPSPAFHSILLRVFVGVGVASAVVASFSVVHVVVVVCNQDGVSLPIPVAYQVTIRILMILLIAFPCGECYKG